MKISLAFFFCIVLSFSSLVAQSSSPSIPSTTDSSAQVYVIELINNNTVQGELVSDDGREIGIKTSDRGLIFIPKYEIKSMTLAEALPEISNNRVFPNPHPGRYFYSPSGISMKQGDAYYQAIYYLVFQAQYAITDHWSVGATTSIILSPILLNFKYTHDIGTQDKLHFVTGMQGGSISAWNSDNSLGVAYAGLTFGNAEHNLTLNGGALYTKYLDYQYDPATGEGQDVKVRETAPAISLSFNHRIGPKASLMGEFWYVIGNSQNIFVGGPGIRTYSGKKKTIDVAILRASATNGFASGLIPMISWTQRFGE
jgi:hypothetical protein